MVVWTKWVWGKRVVRFLTVAATCTILQEILLLIFTRHYDVDKLLANGIAFFASAQANFTLSALLTWNDRKLDWPVQKALVRWAQFNSIALVALVVNEAVFKAATRYTHLPIVAASLAGVLIGAIVTFKCNNGLTFRTKTVRSPIVELDSHEQFPTYEELYAATLGRTLAFFLPAYREAGNLTSVVVATLAYLRSLALKEIRLVIVNDGSTDNTGAIANALAQKFPEVVAYHHTVNRGYGGALATGFGAVTTMRTVDGRPYDLYGFSDSDGQFRPESVGTLLVAHHKSGADMMVGRRLTRESQARARLGKAWHQYSQLAVGNHMANVSDVDCGLKVGHTAALSAFSDKLFGRVAAISPELIARSTMAGHRIEECPVTYEPRKSGKSTGSSPKVILISGIHILLVGIALRAERYFGKSVRLAGKPKGQVVTYDGNGHSVPWPILVPVLEEAASVPAEQSAVPTRKRDRAAWFVGAIACLLSIAAYVVTVRHHATLLYGDAISHLEIARRMIDGTSPGLAQLGGVWPPLPHILELPLVWSNRLYFDGFAGSLVSMLAYVATVVLVYKIVFHMTKSTVAGIVSAAVVALSANELYMQSTPMTESLLFCLLALTVYCIQQWADTNNYRWLTLAGIAAFLGTLTRYESWVVLAALFPVVVVIALYSHTRDIDLQLRRARARDRIVLFLLPAAAGIAGWMVWNAAIFGSPLAFQTGQYAKPSLWLTSHELAIHHWWIAFKTYSYAVIDNVSWPILLVSGLGIICLALELRAKHIAPRVAAPTLTLLIIWPFYVVSLYTGQRPLHITPIDPDLYNVRFGLVMLLPVAILSGLFVSFLVRRIDRFRPAVVALCAVAVLGVAGITGLTLHQHGPITYREALGSQSPMARTVAKAFVNHYNGGLVLAQSFGNEGIVFYVPSNELIYEGSYRLWPAALRSPSANHIKWIIARCGASADEVCNTVNAGEFARYNLVWHSPDDTYRIYEIKRQFQELALGS